MTTLWHHNLRYFICCRTNIASRHGTAPWMYIQCFPSVELKALHRHFLPKPQNISPRYCQTGDKFHSLIMWNTLVNIDVPFRKLLQSVFCSSHDVSQGVNQWCNVKLSALPRVSGEDRCVWQHTVAQRKGGSCGKSKLTILLRVLPFSSYLHTGVPPFPPSQFFSFSFQHQKTKQ